jgi:hypothetical protein
LGLVLCQYHVVFVTASVVYFEVWYWDTASIALDYFCNSRSFILSYEF